MRVNHGKAVAHFDMLSDISKKVEVTAYVNFMINCFGEKLVNEVLKEKLKINECKA